jgi:hypothetical protein
MQTLIGIRLAGTLAVGVTAALVLVGEAGALVPAQQSGFEINGELESLYPGAQATLDARVTNPQPFAIRVVSVEEIVHDATAGCPGSLLEIGGLRSPVDVPAGATATAPLGVHMARSAPDACQDATFAIDFVATAVGAGAPASTAPSPGTAGRGGLAFTGADIAELLAIALSLVAVGLLARRAVHRRRRTAA